MYEFFMHIRKKGESNGEIIETGTPTELFDHPKHERTKLFLSKIL